MKKVFLILICFIFFNCTNNDNLNNCFFGIQLNETINLSNPQFIDIQVPGGSTVANIGGRTILILRQNNSSYKAFDLQCPERDCNSMMTFDGLKLTCPCSGKEYETINGGAIDGEGCPALRYIAVLLNNNTLQIST
ncbi:Rieske (2Fe-2S) protein [Tenacibaculum sp. M341]|uniref:Rieske (2Fe-2S) protein n=1 Tax=Tenacibaculum sp. M341 TaxID=2530339 RepID=UPI00104F73D5|nr:Rieske 2Fe-2S domain-containing protein [Tenacibaculum sp. M341]TCI85148.1 hypothetical protein EYW44_17715 [Tenacibaculum sp. M341]